MAILLSVPGVEATEEEKLGFPLAEQLNELLSARCRTSTESSWAASKASNQKRKLWEFILSVLTRNDLPKRLIHAEVHQMALCGHDGQIRRQSIRARSQEDEGEDQEVEAAR